MRELERFKIKYGKEHPITLSSMYRIGVELNKFKRHKESYDMHIKTLELRKKSLGIKHANTLSSMH